MAGRPIDQMNMKKLDDIGENNLFDRLAAGQTMTGLVKELGIGKRLFYKWMRSVEGREDRYYSARNTRRDALRAAGLARVGRKTKQNQAQRHVNISLGCVTSVYECYKQYLMLYKSMTYVC
jgi:hypothetical protein